MKPTLRLLPAVLALTALLPLAWSCNSSSSQANLPDSAFIRIQGQDLIAPDGSKFFIKGTNLGNWLNPEGYMFGFQRANSARLIDDVISQLVGPQEAAAFWREFKDRYVTRQDIDFIAAQGANTIRLPFHYKLFTDEDFMGLSSAQDGFARIDSVISWCRDNNIYIILDMHDAPGGQTGDNIDDSYGYPWLLENEEAQQQFCDIWRTIADRFKNEPVILGYDLINEPIAPYFANMEELNAKLQPLHRRVTEAIRQVDKNHIILIGGAQWNANFAPLTDHSYDDRLMFTCHRYGGPATKDAIMNFISFRDSVNLPMYMGEIGHNTDQWQHDFTTVMQENNIGYTFWPYKKIDNSCMVGFGRPAEWDSIVAFAEAPRGTFAEIRAARPSQDLARRALAALLDSIAFPACTPQDGYITSLQLK